MDCFAITFTLNTVMRKTRSIVFSKAILILTNKRNSQGISVMPALKRTRLTASAWRKANWCINCVLMRVMERRERDNS